MSVKLSSLAEREAKKAEDLPAFGALNLLHVKRQVAELLKLIGRDGIFDEYTSHDIEHVNKMLAMLEWLIPDSTKKLMGPADWLLAVMGIYFHDVGMLVTRHEFDQRHESDFAKFCENVLFEGELAEDYKHKVDGLAEPDRSRFLYQEFVRHHHAERIRWWVNGTACAQLGISHKAAQEVDELLRPLGAQFRRDLGLVAESHHLNDLDDLKKYQPSQPYGDSDNETANLQYAAVVLRAADLLHITSDRTPAVAFRVINPVDPLSQREWAKQRAVTRVRSKVGVNKDGDLDQDAPRDTVEVHAYFRKEDGFFGLTAYLGYAAQQLAKCYDWVSGTQRKGLAAHSFPWSKLDDSNIETEEFMRDAFQFTIDQAKILDLLTGHTLYNDSSVVLRELAQNSLDAIRLRRFETPDSLPGEVHITWNSAERVLTVLDNGTGMTQRTISEHLLKVGASLYQDPDFKKQHPTFSSISRFGIGVLSTFMIADNVEIVTSHRDEENARRLVLRSVHGKYLVRLLSKHDDSVKTVVPHGTLFRLHVRRSVDVPDILQAARNWIVFPDCRVTVSVDGGAPIKIGFDNPGAALRHLLQSRGYDVVDSTSVRPHSTGGKRSVCVVEKRSVGVDVAYAVQWSEYFHEWAFLNTHIPIEQDEPPPIGTCVEGIRIDAHSPGFEGRPFVAIANCSGEASPKTNVARSGLESGPGRDHLLKTVYSTFCAHASDEIVQLQKTGRHSLTWAVQEAQYLLSPLISPGSFSTSEIRDEHVVDADLRDQSLRELPILLMESSCGREVLSCKDLTDEPFFWTIQCPLLTSAENLIRESPADASIHSVMQSLGCADDLPQEKILCCSTQLSLVDSMAFEQREVGQVILRRGQRRLDLAWHRKADPPRWVFMPRSWSTVAYRLGERRLRAVSVGYRRISHNVLFSRGDVQIEGRGDEEGFCYRNTMFLISENPAVIYAKNLLEKEIAKGKFDDRTPPVIGVISLIAEHLARGSVPGNLDQFVTHVVSEMMASGRAAQSDPDEWMAAMQDKEFVSGLRESNWTVFDALDWERHQES